MGSCRGARKSFSYWLSEDGLRDVCLLATGIDLSFKCNKSRKFATYRRHCMCRDSVACGENGTWADGPRGCTTFHGATSFRFSNANSANSGGRTFSTRYVSPSPILSPTPNTGTDALDLRGENVSGALLIVVVMSRNWSDARGTTSTEYLHESRRLQYMGYKSSENETGHVLLAPRYVPWYVMILDFGSPKPCSNWLCLKSGVFWYFALIACHTWVNSFTRRF